MLARGVRGGRRKDQRALLEPGSYLDLVLRRAKGPLPLLAEATPRATIRRARTDLDRLALLTYGVEICAELAPEHHEAPKLYRLLLAWLDLLEGEDQPGPASRQALEAKALTFAGFTPALVACAVCGERLEEGVVFSSEAGGGAHVEHARGTKVQADQLLRMEALRRTPLKDTPGVRPAVPTWLLGDFIRWNLGRAIKSRGLVEDLERT